MGCDCDCGCGPQKVLTKAEEVKMLKEYQHQLDAESKKVAAKLKELSK